MYTPSGVRIGIKKRIRAKSTMKTKSTTKSITTSNRRTSDLGSKEIRIGV